MKAAKVAGVCINNKPMKYLGAFLGVEDLSDMNFKNALAKVWVIATRWQKQNLTLPAQILVIKTFLFSIFVHTLNTVHIKNKHLEVIQRIMNDFL